MPWCLDAQLPGGEIAHDLFGATADGIDPDLPIDPLDGIALADTRRHRGSGRPRGRRTPWSGWPGPCTRRSPPRLVAVVDLPCQLIHPGPSGVDGAIHLDELVADDLMVGESGTEGPTFPRPGQEPLRSTTREASTMPAMSRIRS